MAYSFQPYINYLGVHLVLTGFFDLFPFLLVPKFLDTFLFPLDSLLRAISVTGTIALFDNPNMSPTFRSMNTPFGHLLLGALASASGGISLSTFSLFSPEWRFSTPPILNAGLWASADVWGGALAALLFDMSTHSQAFTLPTLDPSTLGKAYFPINLIPGDLFRLFLQPSLLSSTGKGSDFHLLVSTPLPIQHGKALAAIALMAVFGSRAVYTHWLPRVQIDSRKLKTTAKKNQ
ncbi:hypothetical protein MD484_g2317, partial [Candolleomyces efflorescens]